MKNPSLHTITSASRNNSQPLEDPPLPNLAAKFPGRSTLYVHEVAQLLSVTTQHITNVIEEGKLHAINVGTSSRKFWRIPLESLAEFISKRHNLNQ